MHMVSLTQILSSILAAFYTLSALKRHESLRQLLDRARPIQLRLKHWHAHLPKSLSIDDTKPRKLSSVGYLHLAYYTTEISIHRAILRAHSSHQPDSPPSLDLILITRQAVSTRFTAALTFIKKLKQEHYQSFWYFSSAICFAIVGVFGAVLACTSLDEDERQVWREGVGELRWLLRLAGQGAGGKGVTEYAVGVLDGLEERLKAMDGGQANGSSEQHRETISPVTSNVSPDNASSMVSPSIAGGMWTLEAQDSGFQMSQLNFMPEAGMQHEYPDEMNGFAAFDMSYLT